MLKFKPTKRQTAECEKLVLKWQAILFLNSWIITHVYSEVNESNPGVLADCEADATYMRVRICFYPSYFASSKWVRENAAIHELIHCIVEPMQDQLRSLRDGRLITSVQRVETMERCVSLLTNAFHMLEGGGE